MAFLIDRAGTYYAAFNVDGKRKVLTTKIKVGNGVREQKKNKELAQAQADLYERTANGYIDVDDAISTLRTLAGVQARQVTILEFFKNYRAGGTEINRQKSKAAIQRFLTALGDKVDMPLADLKPSHLIEYYTQQLERVTINTVRVYRAYISSALNVAVADDLITKNPHIGVKLTNIRNATNNRVERQPFTIDDIVLMRAKFPVAWVDMINICLWLGGQRIGDVACLQWSSIDFKSKLVTIRTGKTGKMIYNPLLPSMEARLLEIKELQEEDEKYVLPNMAMQYNSSSAGILSAQFTHLLREFGIIGHTAKQAGDRRATSPKSFHSLRHTVATLLRSNLNVSADVSRAIVGHDSELVERAYSQPDMQSKLDAMTRLDNLIG